MDTVLGKGRGLIRRNFVRGPWRPAGLVSAIVPLGGGGIACARPSKPGYEQVTYKFVQHQGPPPEPHEKQFYTDLVRYMSDPVSTVTLSLVSFASARATQDLQIRALPGQRVVTVFVENVNPNAGIEFLDPRRDAMSASHHFLAYYDLIDPSRRCLPEPSCCDALCAPPVYCFSPLMR
jgi:hypothetical protein